MRQSLGISLLCFVFFLFISYYFMDKLRRDSMEECVSCTKIGLFGIYSRQILILLFTDLFFTLTVIGYNIYILAITGTSQPEALLHILLCVFLYIFLPSAVSVFFGSFTAMTMQRLPACLLMIFYTLTVSPLMRFIIEAKGV